VEPNIEVGLRDLQQFADFFRIHAFDIAKDQNLFQSCRECFNRLLHGVHGLPTGEQLFRRLVVLRLRRKGPMAGPVAGLLEAGWIDRFFRLVIVGFKGRKGRIPLFTNATVFGFMN
jgi:hypothetical protein